MAEHSEPLAHAVLTSGEKNATPASASRSSRTESNGSAGTAAGAAEDFTSWLEARGLDPELAVRMGWAEHRDRDGAAWLVIPYERGGKRINRKFRKLGAKEFRNDTGTEHDLWNVDCLADRTLDAEPLVITEGEMDALAVMQCGFPRVVSIPDGWSEKLETVSGQAKFEVFRKNEDDIKRAKRIVVAGDNDTTGHAFLRAVANFFPENDVRYAVWPEGCKDANDALLKAPESVSEGVKRARRVDPPGGLVTGFTDLPPRPYVQVWKPGFTRLDRLMAFRTREISVLTGIPGSGKTTFATWIAHHLVRTADIRVGLGMFETDPEEVFQHLFRLRTGSSHQTAGSKLLAETRAALDRNYRLFHRTDDGTAEHGMNWLRDMIRTLAARDGCKLIIVDPWNELEHLPAPGESMTAYTNFALMKLRQWAEKYDIHIMITAHPRKMQPGEKPTGYHISDSAAWANKPGMGWTVHLEENEAHGDHVTLTTWKVRSRQSTGCAPGIGRLQFDPQTMVYREL